MRDIKLEFTHPESIDPTAMKNKVVEWTRVHKHITDEEFLVIREIFDKYEEACKPTKQMRYRVIESKFDESLDVIIEDGTAYYYYFDPFLKTFRLSKHNRLVSELEGSMPQWFDEIILKGSDVESILGDIDATKAHAIEFILRKHRKWDTEMLRDDTLFQNKIDNYKNLKPWKKENA